MRGRRSVRPPALGPAHRPERIAAFFDLENLLYPLRAKGDIRPGVQALGRFMRELEARGTVVTRLAVCDRPLRRRLCLQLDRLGIRTFTHWGGFDAADRALVQHLRGDLPASCGVVIIGSGDHAFAPEAARLRAEGRSVEVLALPTSLSGELRRAADRVHRFITRGGEAA